ncbi:hypothetical protein CASFOL_023711 [Castilleja foliolosa]|uniref:Uncharacterized protein n=1 Tax=Castilleja foliolosa TaxID=1961234 RepID=A0ABD3CMN5_9LAMI
MTAHPILPNIIEYRIPFSIWHKILPSALNSCADLGAIIDFFKISGSSLILL